MTKVVKEESSSDEDIPLARHSSSSTKPQTIKKKLDTPVKANKRNLSTVKKQRTTEASDDDDIPLARRRSATAKEQPIKEESSDDDDVPLAKRKPVVTQTKSLKRATPVKAESAPTNKKPKKEVKVEEDVYRWWEQEMENGAGDNGLDDNGIKWTQLSHNGVLFPPEYVPHGIQMKYDGKSVKLTPEAEEVASFFAALLESDHGANPTFQKNFFEDFQKVLAKSPKNPKMTSFEKCDFRPMWQKFELDKERKKQMTKEEKLKIKEERIAVEQSFIYANVDGRKEKIGNFRIEPPGLFRGRGDHPKTGRLKLRVYPEQITLNLSKDSKIPPALPGHKWGKIVHDQQATWLATWKENINDTSKYVFLSANSSWKGQSDMKKFDKARELKGHVDRIRKNYTNDLKDKLTETRQRATAMYLIDRLALRAGNEKGDEEADTVGCCSLRYEHITLESPNTVHFDFLGKDSIRYENSVQVETQVFKNLRLFQKQVGPGNAIFDRLTTTGLNKHLNNYMPGLSAKVFRTYNASFTCQQQLDKLTSKTDTIHDRILSFNRANREVAVLCNHQRAASKSHGQQMMKIADKLRATKYQRMKLRKQLFALDKSIKKRRPNLAVDESDLEDDWIKEYDIQTIEKEREKAKVKFDKQNDRLKSEGKAPLPKSELQDKLKKVDELKAQLDKERKTGKVEVAATMNVEKLLAKIEKLDERINATKIQATDKEENKEISLGTSKMNYIDPRIIVAWCRTYEVPMEKVYSKTLVEKFRWAETIPDDWKF
ncbi:hypothetical protein BCR42DRAFT_330683 [Absidia repens]|uniref:DNA topoisomerase I n=1 Tax=Absidia repens TaxID=90262 RepID=A0A1X2IBV1_9FUNG|nr:hypothetical protein BCR42DRAFT_330683 [Absidia repens]